MNLGTFLVGACAAFFAVTLAAPAVSLLGLRRERARLAATSRPAPLLRVFYTVLLLWAAAACVAGVVLALLLGVVVLANSQAARGFGVPGEATAPRTAVAAVGAVLAVLSTFGYWLHRFAARKLLAPSDTFPPKNG